MKESIKKKDFPTHPGCYLMKDSTGKILYVGKAKNVRKRVSSYWRTRDIKTQSLVDEIDTIDFIVTDTEVEALILEAELIQEHHPRYNIDLQSKGRYAFIKLTDEEYPRFIIARKIASDGKYFGPYPSAAARNAVLKSIHRIFRLCAHARGKKACMRYHLEVCSGSCIGAVPTEEYRRSTRMAEKFLHGEVSGLIEDARRLMTQAVTAENFEKAKIYRDQITDLEKIEQQKVSDPKRFDQDVVYYCVRDDAMIIQIFHFHRGIISGRKEFSYDLSEFLALTAREAFQEFIQRYYAGISAPHEIVVQEKLPDHAIVEAYLTQIGGRQVSLTVPQKGLKKQLLEMVKKNIYARFEEGGGQLHELQQALHLSVSPRVINCIDISTLGGTETVGSLVQFKNGQPYKAGYRKFIIKSVEGINDFASVNEVVTRFAKRVLEKKEERPDLLVIDGGKGQLNSALKALAEAGLQLPVVGLAKRLEEIYVSWAPRPLHLLPKSPALQMLRALRDEAHRFAITFQRKRRKIPLKLK